MGQRTSPDRRIEAPSASPIADNHPQAHSAVSRNLQRFGINQLAFPSVKYRLKTATSSSLLNSTLMITPSCARSYSNLDGAHLCLSSHSRIPAISDEKSASGGSLMMTVRICSDLRYYEP